jgi:hypothetical protein
MKIDKISCFTGVSAFFYHYAKEFDFDRILTANDSMVLLILKNEFDQLPKDDKKILIYSEENKFYHYIIKLRTLFNCWRDMNTKLPMQQISEICQQLIDFIVDLIEKDAGNSITLQKEDSKVSSD